MEISRMSCIIDYMFKLTSVLISMYATIIGLDNSCYKIFIWSFEEFVKNINKTYMEQKSRTLVNILLRWATTPLSEVHYVKKGTLKKVV